MSKVLSLLHSLDWIAVSSLFVAVVSFVVARKTLKDAEEYWKQQKWFDLYAKAGQAYDDLDEYRTLYKGISGIQTVQQQTDWNALMFSIRNVHTMAMVFPVCPMIDNLVKATNHFEHPSKALEDWRLPLFFDALEGLRSMALLHTDILKMRKVTK